MVQALSKNLKKARVYTKYTYVPANKSDVASNTFLRKAESDAEDLMDIPEL